MTRLLLRGGRVLTPTGEGAGAVLLDGDTVAWVGRDEDAPSTARQIDLDGRLVTPAFVDAHVHLAATGLAAMGADLSSARSAAEALDLLAVHARSTALGIVLAHDWDETRWTGGVAFTRAELDRAVGGRPAYVSRVDLHSAFASTALVEAADATVATLPGWSAEGAQSREAHHAVRDAMLRLLTRDDRAAAIRLALQTAASRGIGLVHEMGAPHINSPSDLEIVAGLQAAARRDGRALPDVVAYWGELGAVLAPGVTGAAGDICVDGAIGSRTAALHAPYTDDASTSGHLYLTADQVADHVITCTEAGVQAGFHVIGDRASAETVAGLEKAAARLGEEAVRRARHRIEHAELLGADQVQVLARLGVTASMQPLFDAWWGGPGGLYETRLGDRARGMNAFASLHAAGVPLAFGSDSPVTPLDPWAAVRAAVLHHEPGHRLDVASAFAAHTAGGWDAAGRAGGLVEPGAPAYLAVWDTPIGPDLREVADPEQALPTCALTLVAGTPAYDGGGFW